MRGVVKQKELTFLSCCLVYLLFAQSIKEWLSLAEMLSVIDGS